MYYKYIENILKISLTMNFIIYCKYLSYNKKIANMIDKYIVIFGV
jgi:hypothetical protein